MRPDPIYAGEKLGLAALLLRERGEVREQLLSAWADGLGAVQEYDMPEPLRAELLAIKAALTACEPTADEGAVRATLGVLDDGTLHQVRTRIIDLSAAMDHYLETET